MLLSGRERQVLTLIASGMSSGQVAEEIGVVKRTVDFHLDRIYEKLGVTNRVQAINMAVQMGILTMPVRPPDPS